MAKYVDYEFTPEVFHYAVDQDGKDKSFRAPAKIVFIAEDGSRRHVPVGGTEAESLMAEVAKNNPEAHGDLGPSTPVNKLPEGPSDVQANNDREAQEKASAEAQAASGKPLEG